MKALGSRHMIEVSRAVAAEPGPLADLARRCYPDMAVTVEDAADVWRVRLSSLAPIATAYDPDLGAVLTKSGIGLQGMARWRRHRRAGHAIWLESLSNAWALLGWSEWLAAGGGGRPLMIFIGGRTALRAPELVCEPDLRAFVGLMDDELVHLDRPDTVAAAIERGVIGAGSFVTPFLRACPADILHIIPDPMTAEEQEPSRFTVSAAAWAPDPTVDCLALHPSDGGDCSHRDLTLATGIAAHHVAGRPVFVHIDLSYFDQLGRRQRLPAPRAVDPAGLLAHLEPLAGAIEVVTMAYAPGSCPARRWEPLASAIRSALQPLLTP